MIYDDGNAIRERSGFSISRLGQGSVAGDGEESGSAWGRERAQS